MPSRRLCCSLGVSPSEFADAALGSSSWSPASPSQGGGGCRGGFRHPAAHDVDAATLWRRPAGASSFLRLPGRLKDFFHRDQPLTIRGSDPKDQCFEVADGGIGVFPGRAAWDSDPLRHALLTNRWRRQEDLKYMDREERRDLLISKLWDMQRGSEEELRRLTDRDLARRAPMGVQTDGRDIVWEESPQCMNQGKVRIVLAKGRASEKAFSNEPEEDRLAEQVHRYHVVRSRRGRQLRDYAKLAERGACGERPAGEEVAAFEVANGPRGGECDVEGPAAVAA